LLKNLLTYPLHGLFGGKTALAGRLSVLPKQRMVLLWITLGLNVYYSYMTRSVRVSYLYVVSL
jgi:hypothetical protein